ncbi:MAG: hypothetical protein IJE46_06145 [Clostridia bacterium]|nr:hypothetical protein [Clostridia bacterium]
MNMSDFSTIDKNFAVETKIEKQDIKFYSSEDEMFKIYGIYKEDGKYRRMPESVAKIAATERDDSGLVRLHSNTAGGRIRFVTDSSYVAINVQIDTPSKLPHMAWTGSLGFDLYADNEFVNTFVPPWYVEDKYESVIGLGEKKEREITINFPLYCNVTELYIGLQEDAIVKDPAPYKNKKPIVYYGSSITQGACASRPGRSYQSIISRKFNYDYINLGFSGNAQAEETMIEYIKSLDMSAFVYDYDHNALTVEYLEKTHEKMFKAIREQHPDIPIIMMPRPKFYLTDKEIQRHKIIETTYKNAIATGDKNVYFITSKELTKLCGNEGVVDDCHPNDFGFASMAKALEGVMETINLI